MADRGLYTVAYTTANVQSIRELWSIQPLAGKSIELVGLYLGQTTELAEAQEEQVHIAICRVTGTAPSGGTAATPILANPSSPAFAGTSRINDSTLGVTPEFIHRDAYNIRAGYQLIFPPEMRPEIRNAHYLTVRLVAALTDVADIHGTLWFREN